MKTIHSILEARPTPGLYGIEVELEGSSGLDEVSSSGWRSLHDGSLRNYHGASREFVSQTTVANAKAAVVAYGRLLGDIENAQVTLSESPRTSTHVHTNMQHRSVLEVFAFVCGYLLLEQSFFSLVDQKRIGNIFCIPLVDQPSVVRHFVETVSAHGSIRWPSADYCKYSALNLSALRKFGSLEFRHLQAPVSQDTFTRWMRSIDNLNTLTFGKTPTQVLELYYKNPKAFCQTTVGSVVLPTNRHLALCEFVSSVTNGENIVHT